jgi:hypothetical protein
MFEIEIIQFEEIVSDTATLGEELREKTVAIVVIIKLDS